MLSGPWDDKRGHSPCITYSCDDGESVKAPTICVDLSASNPSSRLSTEASTQKSRSRSLYTSSTRRRRGTDPAHLRSGDDIVCKPKIRLHMHANPCSRNDIEGYSRLTLGHIIEWLVEGNPRLDKTHAREQMPLPSIRPRRPANLCIPTGDKQQNMRVCCDPLHDSFSAHHFLWRRR